MYRCSGSDYHLPACGGTCGEIGDAATIRPLTFIVRCPDGSWSKWGSRRCKLDLGHAGKHVYEVVTRDGTEVRLGR